MRRVGVPVGDCGPNIIALYVVHFRLESGNDVFNEIIRIDRGKYSEGFLYFVLCGLVKTRYDTRKCFEERETEILSIKLARWNGVVIEKISQCERAAAVIGERADFLGEGFLIIYGLVDVVEYLGLCDFFECDIATLGEREAAAFVKFWNSATASRVSIFEPSMVPPCCV